MKLIDKFDGEEYGFLSNFYECQVNYNGITYNHSEGAYQAQKSLDENDRRQIAELSPGKAKRAVGRKGLIQLRPDWEEVKDSIMYEIVKAKFEQNPELKNRLLATADAELVEGTVWHDNYWGNCNCDKCKSIDGKNHLGKILMKVREELRNV